MLELIRNGKDFVALDVMIQIEFCSDLTLRDYIIKRESVDR